MQSTPPFAGNISFNAQHAPMGAFFSFTCGHFGTQGGFGLQIGRPGDQDLYVGIKDGGRADDAPLKCLPFYAGAAVDEAARYDVGKTGGAKRPGIASYGKDDVRRTYAWGTDTWATDDFTFVIHTPFGPIPDPDIAGNTEMRDALLPAVTATLTIDNRHGKQTRTGFFALRFGQPGMRLLDGGLAAGSVGFAWRGTMGVAGTIGDGEGAGGREPFVFAQWSAEAGVAAAEPHLLGSCPGIGFEVPAGERRELRLVLGVYLADVVTTRLEGRYLYTNYFGGLLDVLGEGLARHTTRAARARANDASLERSSLSADQQFLIAHATRSYYGSTQLLDVGGRPFWVVNEGEYCMMNTLDLSVDQVFWELDQNPWVVKNLLDTFVRHYSYVDRVKVPKATPGSAVKRGYVQGSDAEAASGHGRSLGAIMTLDAFDVRPGGISFCHDMGVHNNFSPLGRSSYELADLVGCFSYMTAEQLCNWLLIAGTYVAKTGDTLWAQHNRHVIDACLSSMIARGGDTGATQFDSTRCGTGSEITTYDSLDHSLAQTRNNLYMAVKCWAAYLAAARLLVAAGEEVNRDTLAREYARRCAGLVGSQVQPDGTLPAVFETDNPGFSSRILPAVEGLIYPLVWGDTAAISEQGEYGEMIRALRTHTAILLGDPQRRNLFGDNGIKLSSTSSNSWMSKIAIFMHVCREALSLPDEIIQGIFPAADAAHTRWQTETQGHDGSAFWACCDQMVDGVAKGSKYYPRIITSALWLKNFVS